MFSTQPNLLKDQVSFLYPSVRFMLNLPSAAGKKLYSDWLKIHTQNQTNIYPLNCLGHIICNINKEKNELQLF